MLTHRAAGALTEDLGGGKQIYKVLKVFTICCHICFKTIQDIISY